MPLPPPHASRHWLLVGGILLLSVLTLGLQAVVLRPRLWPAGAGLSLWGDTVMGPFAAPRPVAVTRPPDVRKAAGARVVVTDLWPGGSAAQAGLQSGTEVTGFIDAAGERRSFADGLPSDPAEVLRIWRDVHTLGPQRAVTLSVADPSGGAQARLVTLTRPAVWDVADGATWVWLRRHLGPLTQAGAFLAGAIVLVALGARGITATLMTLALTATAVANSGPLLGAEAAIPVLAPLLLLFNWLVTPLSFPVIGLAVLYFPQRDASLDRRVIAALSLAAAPMLVTSVTSAAFLMGADAVLPLLTWLAARPWAFDLSFALALGANVLIVIEGVGRFRSNPDANERRRIQIVVFTGVPAVFAYALKTGVPLVSGVLGRPVELPWMIEAALQAIVLLPAFGLPYAVAVRHVFSPRTVLRRGMQYAFARRTLAALVVLPAVALGLSLVQQRDQPLSAIVSGRPLFYVACVVLMGAGLAYRVRAQAWLDRPFFRAEYDAREILLSLAGRVPYEADPRELVALVITQIDSALHPEGLAVLASDAAPDQAGQPGRFEPVGALHIQAEPLPGQSGLITLLRWSDKPLEVFLDDELSQVARLPASDRAWLAAARIALLVPIFAGGSDPRPLVGLLALGPKRSDEPFTPEDRQLLGGIAVQMGVALDLSRLRRQVVGSQAAAPEKGSDPFSSGSLPTIAAIPAVGIGAGVVVDNKYRVERAIGQGGMGAVYRAWDLRLERPVAIKVMRADLLGAPDSRVRFRRESQMVARLQHPAIVTVFDYGNLPDGAAFLVMEFVSGEDLRQLLRREGPLPVERVASLMDGIAAGVDAAHEAGILHRDLKPENILLPERGTGPKVVDFGVAKMTNSGQAEGGTITIAGSIVGTPAYMAPEQLRGEPLDGRGDVYSLGVMTYEMLTGRLPFGGGSFFEIGVKQAAGEAAVDTSGLGREVSAVIRRAIAFDRSARPDSPLQFARALRESLAGPR